MSNAESSPISTVFPESIVPGQLVQVQFGRTSDSAHGFSVEAIVRQVDERNRMVRVHISTEDKIAQRNRMDGQDMFVETNRIRVDDKQRTCTPKARFTFKSPRAMDAIQETVESAISYIQNGFSPRVGYISSDASSVSLTSWNSFSASWANVTGRFSRFAFHATPRVDAEATPSSVAVEKFLKWSVISEDDSESVALDLSDSVSDLNSLGSSNFSVDDDFRSHLDHGDADDEESDCVGGWRERRQLGHFVGERVYVIVNNVWHGGAVTRKLGGGDNYRVVVDGIGERQFWSGNIRKAW